MANERRRRYDFVAGALSAGLSTSDTTLSSAALADMPAVGSTEHVAVSLFTRDTDGRVTKKETVWVTAHTASATTATVIRAQEGTTAQTWSTGDKWVAGPTARDLNDFIIRKAAAETRTSTTLEDDDELFFPIAANERFYAEWVLLVDGATSGDIIVGITVPAGATGWRSLWYQGTGAASEGSPVQGTSATVTTTLGSGTLGATVPHILTIRAVIENSSTAGDVKLQWAQRISDATATTVRANSLLIAQRLP